MGETFWEPLVELYVILDGLPATQEEDPGVFCLCSRAIMCNPVHQPLERTEYENGSIEDSSSDEFQEEILLNNVSILTSLSNSKDKQKGDSEEPGSCYGSASTDEPDSLCGVRNGSDSGADFGETLGTKQTAQWEQHWAVHGPQIVWESWQEKYASYMDPTASVNFADPYPGDSVPVLAPEEQTAKPDVGEAAGPEAEQETNALPPTHEGCLERIEDGMKSLGVAFEKDRSSPLSVVSSDFEPEQTASSNTWSEDSMTDVTRLSATSADLSLTSDSREDENAAAWQAEWDRHCAEQYTAEYLAFARKLVGNNTEDSQVLLDVQEILEEVQEVPGEDQRVFVEVQGVPEEAQKVSKEAQEVPWEGQGAFVEAQGIPEEGLEPISQSNHPGGGTETPAASDKSATHCSGNEKDVSAAAKSGRKDVTRNGSQTTSKQNTSYDWRSRNFTIENSVGYLLHSLAHQSQPSDADGGGAEEGVGQGEVTNETPANQGGANATTSANHSASNSNASGSGNDPPERRPSRPAKRPHEEDVEGVEEKQPIDNVGGALTLLGLSVATPPLAGHAHFSKRPSAIRAQNRRLKFGNKQPRMSGIRGDAESSDDEPPTVEPIGKPIADQDSSTIEETLAGMDQEVVIAETELMEIQEDPSEAGTEASATEDIGDEPWLVDSTVAKSRGPFLNVPAPAPFVQRAKRKRNQRKRGVPLEVRANPGLRKFWNRRFQLFSRFNEGIRMDAESWYSVTPEAVAVHLAERCKCDLIVDAFCGAGGNAIQFAFTCERVIAVDIDPVKLSLARHNAKVYGVADRIDFVLGDFTRLAPSLHADVVFLSPPWGGTKYMTVEPFPLERVLPPLGGAELFRLAQLVSENVAYYLPRNTDTKQVISLGGSGSQCEIEQSFLDRQHVAITAYYGDLVHSE